MSGVAAAAASGDWAAATGWTERLVEMFEDVDREQVTHYVHIARAVGQ